MPTDGQRGHISEDATADPQKYAGNEAFLRGAINREKSFQGRTPRAASFTSGTGRKEVEPRDPAPFALFL